MKKARSTAAFVDSAENKKALLSALDGLKGMKGSLLPAMQAAQEIYGYLPIEVQEYISQEMDVPMSEIYGVATFYSQFNLAPKGEFKISVCLGTACYVKNAQDIFDKISARLGIKNDECTADGKFSLEACRCIGACGLAPVVTINEDVYGNLLLADVDKMLDNYK